MAHSSLQGKKLGTVILKVFTCLRVRHAQTPRTNLHSALWGNQLQPFLSLIIKGDFENPRFFNTFAVRFHFVCVSFSCKFRFLQGDVPKLSRFCRHFCAQEFGG